MQGGSRDPDPNDSENDSDFMRKIFEKLRTAKARKGKGTAAGPKDDHTILEREVTMTSQGHINYRKILENLCLPVDLVTVGKLIKNIPEER